ncbi:MAG TPA: TetR/AcrR family transcriptional regulator [Baekduia sp.]
MSKAAEAAEATAPANAMISRAIEVGADLFSERGYHATTTRDLSRALGVTNGTFYHYFPSKELLLLKICKQAVGGMIETVSRALEGTTPSREQILALIEAHQGTRQSNRRLYLTMLIEQRALSEENMVDLEQMKDAYRDLVTRVLHDAQEGGIMRTDLSADTLTLGLLNLVNYAMFRTRDQSERVMDAETLCTIFLDGAAPR